jgi:hypothetical protein
VDGDAASDIALLLRSLGFFLLPQTQYLLLAANRCKVFI